MTWLDAHHDGYLAWVWDAWHGSSCTPSSDPYGDIDLISSYDGTPYPGMGVAYRAHLACLWAGSCKD
jgi:hypothetical protein